MCTGDETDVMSKLTTGCLAARSTVPAKQRTETSKPASPRPCPADHAAGTRRLRMRTTQSWQHD